MAPDSNKEAGDAPATGSTANATGASNYVTFTTSRLKFLEKPFAHDLESENTSLSDEPPKPKPRVEFLRRVAASAPELFYDLWFVANFTVFSSSSPITAPETLFMFLGYFILLWTTWFVTSAYIVRFGQDGILERIGFTCHLAALAGFTLLGISIGKQTLHETIALITCITMAFSRFVLAIQYGIILYQTRRYAKTRNPVIAAVAIHFITGLVYLISGVTINPDNFNEYLLVIWFTVAGVELLAVLLHSAISQTLSFQGTYIAERLSVLTLIVLGEGASILTKNITIIVEYTYIKEIADYWSPPLIGTILCASAILYLCFALYFDWTHEDNILKPIPQALWVFAHIPFHCVLLLLAEGTSQWGIWWRAHESNREIMTAMDKVKDLNNYQNMSMVADSVQKLALRFLTQYGLESESDQKQIQSDVDQIKVLSLEDLTLGTNETAVEIFVNATDHVDNLIYKGIMKAYSVALAKDDDQNTDEGQKAVNAAISRQDLVFQYLFISAGLMLVILMVLHVLSKRKGWSLLDIFRTGTITAIGAALSLVSLAITNSESFERFVVSPWQLPIIFISFFVVLIITHLPEPTKLSQTMWR